MAREIVDLEGFVKRFPFTKNQVYHKIRDRKNPLPYRKAGKKLLFDVERVFKWFDSLPGQDRTI